MVSARREPPTCGKSTPRRRKNALQFSHWAYATTPLCSRQVWRLCELAHTLRKKLAAALAVGARGRPGAKLHGAALNADLVENPCDSSHHLGMCGVEVGAQFARRVCMLGDLVEVDADAVQFVHRPAHNPRGR